MDSLAVTAVTCKPMSVALYIHWPFCKAKCPYCDFNSHVSNAVDTDAWQAAMLSEMRHMAAWMPNETLGSVFFGGGTPSLMPPSLVSALLDEAARLWTFADDIEITLEANPTSVEAQRFADFRAAGINRVSLGIQSLREDSLAFLGREHSVDEARAAINFAQKTFDRSSFDLIYALPKQTAQEWERELGEALAMAQGHVSLYQLTIEPQTAFYHDYHVKKRFKLPKDTLARELFLLTQDMMQDAGLPAYEISNHAAIGQESRHNLTYWRGGAYLGVGAGAHGRVKRDGIWHATQTYKSPQRWLERARSDGHALEICTPIDDDARAEEAILTGLRLREGIALTSEIRAMLRADKLAFYSAQGLLVQSENQLRATPEGWLVLNQLLAEILL